jgi:hypothetical protein
MASPPTQRSFIEGTRSGGELDGDGGSEECGGCVGFVDFSNELRDGAAGTRDATCTARHEGSNVIVVTNVKGVVVEL